ncbi:MAG: hypothetical protein HPY76_08210 [Anaerolineae bacterium]|nr:hypothetical protein [Anaerolineae bacterium]
MNRLIPLLSLVVIVVIAGCNLPGFSNAAPMPTSQSTLSSTPPQPATPDAVATAPSEGYPQTAEGVVGAFLNAYSQDNEAMLQYLSPAAQASLPAGGPAALLDFDGSLNGFLIQSASVVPDPATASVVVVVEMKGKTGAREFQLSQSGGRWAIDSVIDPDK